jgi:hypothetical protein
MLAAGVTAVACAQLGFSDDVLLRVSSPDGRLIFVCQETPEFDGPGHEWRLEKPDGTVVRRLLVGSDGNGLCHEAVWSSDSGTVAIASMQTVHIADVAWTLAHPELQNTHWYVRQFSFGSDDGLRRVQDLQFAPRGELVFGVCEYKLGELRRIGRQCEAGANPKTLTIPSPRVPGQL